MTELLCIEDSYCTHNPDAICVRKGSRYHLEKVIEHKTQSFRGNNIWYRLLETGEFIHNSTLFVIAPPEEEDKNTENEKISSDIPVPAELL